MREAGASKQKCTSGTRKTFITHMWLTNVVLHQSAGAICKVVVSAERHAQVRSQAAANGHDGTSCIVKHPLLIQRGHLINERAGLQQDVAPAAHRHARIADACTGHRHLHSQASMSRRVCLQNDHLQTKATGLSSLPLSAGDGLALLAWYRWRPCCKQGRLLQAVTWLSGTDVWLDASTRFMSIFYTHYRDQKPSDGSLALSYHIK